MPAEGDVNALAVAVASTHVDRASADIGDAGAADTHPLRLSQRTALGTTRAVIIVATAVVIVAAANEIFIERATE